MPRSTLLHHVRCTPNLALDLLASPSGGLNSPGLEITVDPRLLDQGSKPILAEGLDQFSVRVCIGKVTKHGLAFELTNTDKTQRRGDPLPNDTHRSPHQGLATVRIARNAAKQLEDRLHVRLEDLGCAENSQLERRDKSKHCGKLTLGAGLHSTNNATPGIHNAFSQGDDIVEHLVRAFGCRGDSRSLLEHLGNNRKIRLKMTTDGTSNISKTLKDSRLKLVGKRGTLDAVLEDKQIL